MTDDVAQFSARGDTRTGAVLSPAQIDPSRPPTHLLMGALWALATKTAGLVIPWSHFPQGDCQLEIRLNPEQNALDLIALMGGVVVQSESGKAGTKIASMFTASPCPATPEAAYRACLWALTYRAGGFLRIPARDLPLELPAGSYDVKVSQSSKVQRVTVTPVRNQTPPTPASGGLSSDCVVNVIAVDPRDVR